MSRNDNDRTWKARGDREYDRFTQRPGRTGLKWLLIIIAIVLVIGAAIGAASWIPGWGGEAARVTGVKNTREQVTIVLQQEADMVAAASNYCQVKNAPKEDGDPSLIEKPEVAYAAQYRKIKADYDARMGNLFEAYVTKGNPLPGTINHLPRTAPTLEERTASPELADACATDQ